MRRPLAATVAAAVALSALAAAAYGPGAGVKVGETLLPLGVGAVMAGWLASAPRSRIAGLRRQMTAIAAIALAQTAVAVALFVHAMLLSAHDAFFIVLILAYGASLAVCVAGRFSGRALRDVNRIREALRRIGDGARDVEMSASGGGELAAVAADMEAMVARLDADERTRRRLIASVSHDLRTPITALRVMTAAIDDQLVDPPVRDRYLTAMTVHVQALSALAGDLFELSRLEAGDIAWSFEPIAIDELVAESVEAMRPHAEARAIQVDAGLPPSRALVRADAEQMRRVLFNLLENAIRHTPADGTVVVRAEARTGAVEVEVADTGEGISRGDRSASSSRSRSARAARRGQTGRPAWGWRSPARLSRPTAGASGCATRPSGRAFGSACRRLPRAEATPGFRPGCTASRRRRRGSRRPAGSRSARP